MEHTDDSKDPRSSEDEVELGGSVEPKAKAPFSSSPSSSFSDVSTEFSSWEVSLSTWVSVWVWSALDSWIIMGYFLGQYNNSANAMPIVTTNIIFDWLGWMGWHYKYNVRV